MLMLINKDINITRILDSIFSSLQDSDGFPHSFNNTLFESSFADTVYTTMYDTVMTVPDGYDVNVEYGIAEDILWLMYTELFYTLSKIGIYNDSGRYIYLHAELYNNDVILHIN